jgi:hypothetical protein
MSPISRIVFIGVLLTISPTAEATIQACNFVDGHWVSDPNADHQNDLQKVLTGLQTAQDCLDFAFLPDMLSDLSKPGPSVCVHFVSGDNDIFAPTGAPDDPNKYPWSNPKGWGGFPDWPALINIPQTIPPLPEPSCTDVSLDIALAHELAHQWLYSVGVAVAKTGQRYNPDDDFTTAIENEVRRAESSQCLRTQYNNPKLGPQNLPADNSQQCPCDANGHVGLLPCNAPGADATKCGCTDQPDAICCGGRCQDQKDPLNCGSCSNICSTRESCCDKTCVSTNTDAECGGCGIACGGGTHCCDAGCVDTTSDNVNCGMCGNICSDGKVCVGGNCECPSGQTICNGACCDGTCQNGVCCGSGLTNCQGECLDLNTDKRHCGSCPPPGYYHFCDQGSSSYVTGTCSAGKCQYSCPSDQTLAGGNSFVPDSSELFPFAHCYTFVAEPNVAACADQSGNILYYADWNSDPQNCGGCGAVCPGGSQCVKVANLPEARYLTLPVCVCPLGKSLCGGECVDTMSDSTHCGGCFPCAAAQTCRDGQCE